MIVTLVVVIMGSSFLSSRSLLGSGTAALHTLATGLGGMGAGPGPSLGLLALTKIGEHGLLIAAHDDRDVAGALQYLRGASTCTGAPALQRRALVGVTGRHEELLGRDVVVVLSVGHCRIQALADHLGYRSLREGQNLGRTTVGLAPDEVEHRTGLARRHADVLDDRTRPGALIGLQAGHQR